MSDNTAYGSGGPAAAASESLLTTEADVYNLYALTLGRHPESVEVLRGMVGHERKMLIRTFFATDEHVSNVLEPLEVGRRLTGGLFDQAPGDDLLAWAAEVLNLGEDSLSALKAAAASWHRVFAILFADHGFNADAPAGLAARRRSVIQALSVFASVEGRIERTTVSGLSGWVVVPDGADALTVEARIDGRVVALASTSAFRREVQERFGGDGVYGFHLLLPDRIRTSGREVMVDVHETRSGVHIDRAPLSKHVAPLSAHAALLAELSGVRETLARIESALPSVQSDLAFELENYGDWREAYRAGPLPFTDLPKASPLQQSKPAEILVVIDARAAAGAWLDEALASLADQTVDTWAALIVAEGLMAEDLARRTAWRSGRSVEVVTPAAASRSAIPAGVNVVVRIGGGGVLAPDALERLGAEFEANVAAVYWDEDVMAPDQTAGAYGSRRRDRPQLKSAFDLDWLRQDPYLGSGLALRAGALKEIGEGPWSERSASETALRLAERKLPVGHLASILYTAQAPVSADPQVWAVAVQAHLDRVGEPAQARVVDDPLGAAPGVRLEHSSDLSSLSVAVIIPTKDRIDLLKPCLDSVFEAQAANRVAMEVLVVDHESRDPETVAYLKALSQEGRLRLLPYQGAFNWALMNNLAAAQTQADVLVFLNNDTAVITPDWLDRLSRLAVRPDVGAVGARLIFPDGAIQHAGFVSRPLADSFLMPEGVGTLGADGGYLGRHARLRRTAAVTGACMAVRGEVFRRLGGFDAAHLPIDWNDVEFCLKARAQGLTILYEPAATLYHFESRSRGVTRDGDRIAASSRSAALVWERWGQQFGQDADYNAHFGRPGTPFRRLAPPPRPTPRAVPFGLSREVIEPVAGPPGGRAERTSILSRLRGLL